MIRTHWIYLVFGTVLVMAIASPALAHPFHLCVGQMKWNQETKVWEVSLRLHPQDLELAMQQAQAQTQLAGSGSRQAPPKVEKISLDDDGFDEAALSFVESHLFLYRTSSAMNLKEFQTLLKINSPSRQDRNLEQRSKLKWIGKEQEKGWLWLHLEMTPPSIDPSIHKLWLIHDALLDHVERQENTMSVDPAVAAKFSLQFKREETIQEFRKR